jgi:MSHA biogenesis protein MshN
VASPPPATNASAPMALSPAPTAPVGAVPTPAPAPVGPPPGMAPLQEMAGTAQAAPASPPKIQPVAPSRATPEPPAPVVTAAAANADPASAATQPVMPKPVVTPVHQPKPKATDGAAPRHAVEYPESNASEAPTNIEKQVLPPSQRERAEVEFRKGMTALHAGDPAEAEDRFNAALAIDPLADNARQALLGLYIERGRSEDAERLLEDRLRVDRKHAGFAMALGRLQLERGANGDALITLQRSLPFGETSSDYQAMTANALGRVGRHKESAERFEVASRLAPRNPVWLMGLGVELRADNRPAEARAAFQRAHELGGLSPQLASFVDQQLRELK